MSVRGSARVMRGAEYLLVSDNEGMAATLRLARGVAPTPTTVLLLGESGTGKEVVARYIHAASGRAGGPFVAVNCGAIPAGLVESELFGHERGAFSGAHERRAGKFELAQGGTLLLDEISELPLDLQARLLRVLQERELYRVGGTAAVSLDVRVIATSNRDVRAMVQAGTFRQDLYYRLNVFPVALPPLRARREDVPVLAEVILARLCRRFGYAPVDLSAGALSRFEGYGWPGNIRELNNVLERALILSGGAPIGAEHVVLDDEVVAPCDVAPATPGLRESVAARSLRDVERSTILRILRECNGNRTHASERLGISLRTLRNRIREYRDEGVAVPESARMPALLVAGM
ncbi:MAG: hypothetical protein AMXMBFR64_49430 [Myxococcales bacterium]